MGAIEAYLAAREREEAEWDAFADWCDEQGLDPHDDDSWEQWEDYCEGLREDDAERRAEEAREDGWL